MALVVEQRDGFAKAILPKRRRELEARMPRADNHNRPCRHRNSSTECAQGIPMSTPLFADFGACQLHPWAPALVAAPEGWGHFGLMAPRRLMRLPTAR